MHLFKKSRWGTIGSTLVMLIAPCLFTSGVQAADEEPLITFILAGQSNMVGKRGVAKELPAELQKPNENVLFYDSASDKWVPLVPGVSEKQGFGPEISFGAEMARRLGQPVGIIKHSIGGTSLSGSWDPESPRSLYAALVKSVQAAQKNRPLKIAGMFWQQGGRDATKEKDSKAYAKNLEQFIKRCRADFNNPEMPFVAGRLHVGLGSGDKFTHWQIVRDAHQNHEDPDYAWVDCDNLTKGGDNIHFDTKGLVDLGKLAADKMEALLKKSETPAVSEEQPSE